MPVYYRYATPNQTMATQAASIAIALLLFPLFLWVPGITLAYCTNLLDFRDRGIPTQLALGLLLSFACVPILNYLLILGLGFPGAWVLYGLWWAAAAFVTLRNWKAFTTAVRSLFVSYSSTVLFILVCFIAGVFFEVDWVSSNGVRPNFCSMDSTAHVAITDAILRDGIPPANPFVYPGRPVQLLYYYGWYAICSVVAKAGGAAVTARSAVQASKVFVGLGVVSLVVCFVNLVGPRLLPGIKRLKATVGIVLLAVTGLDLLPWVFQYIVYHTTGRGPGAEPSIEWWNEQVTAWLGAILMSPHHPAALVMCMTGLLMFFGLWMGPGREWVMMAVAVLAFASAATTSVYVTLAFAAGLFLWLVWAAVHGWWKDVLRLCSIGAVALLLYFPVAAELHAASRTTRSPIGFTIREFSVVDYWLPSIFKFLKGSSLIYGLRLIFLPLNYFLELGFFFVAALLFWRWRRSLEIPLSKEESTLACLATGTILVCTFLHSTIRWNDLGWRGFLVAQFVLLLWGVPVAEAIFHKLDPDTATSILWRYKPLVAFCLIVGFSGTIVELYNLRVHFWGPYGPSTIVMRDTYEWVDKNTPRNSVVLFNPEQDSDYFSIFYGRRQATVGGLIFPFLYGGVTKQETSVLSDATDLFATGKTVDDVRRFRDLYHVNAVVVFAKDPAWKDSSSWVWKMQPAFTTQDSRVFLLSSNGQLQAQQNAAQSP